MSTLIEELKKVEEVKTKNKRTRKSHPRIHYTTKCL